jgi:ribosomal-protein-alanine N-acetyltransferase
MYYFIEPMVEDDIPQVQQIESLSFTTPWSANTYRRELRNTQSCRYVVARASKNPPPPADAAPAQPSRNGLFGQLLAAIFPRSIAVPVAQPLVQATMVGYGGIWLTLEEAHITTIAVTPDVRGRGVGELLLNALIDHAYDLRAETITLEVRVTNTVAQKLYVKYGFQPAGTRPRYYTDNGEDALIMCTEPINTPAYKERLGELRRQLYARLRENVS